MKIVFVADNIRSMENIGSLFRTADGIGAAAVWSVGISAYPDLGERDTRRQWLRERNTKFIQKTALSGLQTVQADYFATAEDAIARLKEERYQIICVEQTKRSVDFRYNFPLSERVCLVFGNEIDGVSETFLKAANQVIEIPMQGAGKSLNVAVSAGIVGYQLLTRMSQPF